jgi:hypothetical protein
MVKNTKKSLYLSVICCGRLLRYSVSAALILVLLVKRLTINNYFVWGWVTIELAVLELAVEF